MTIDEILQLIRTCNLHQVRLQLEKWEQDINLQVLVDFYTLASKRPKQ